MEPVTHLLTGACLARSSFSRRIAYATVGMTIAAELPDIDTLWGLKGPIASFQHHRGITHTFLGIPVEAALLLAVLFAAHRWRRHRASPSRVPRRVTRKTATPPVRWGALYGGLLLALLSHILLDYTNNYGVRPFFPFDPHWYAASLVFIFDPLLFLFLLTGLLMPPLLRLVNREIGESREGRYATGWPRAALVAVLLLWGLRSYQHSSALDLASRETLAAPAAPDGPSTSSLDPASPLPPTMRPLLQTRRVLASPDPLSPFRWYAAADFGPAYRLSTVDTRNANVTLGRILTKPAMTPILAAARATHLGRVYGDWSSMPWLEVEGSGDPGAGIAGGEATVLFEDLRFLNDSPWLHRGGSPPLTGYVRLDRNNTVLEQGLDGKPGN